MVKFCVCCTIIIYTAIILSFVIMMTFLISRKITMVVGIVFGAIYLCIVLIGNVKTYMKWKDKNGVVKKCIL